MSLGLTLDHRVADGAAGAAFLKDIITHIENIDLEAKSYDK
jgi:pyruvate/2-oxoglutarate dehydrogenase complex dihydrolipoamide acyltransferase (E2) component